MPTVEDAQLENVAVGIWQDAESRAMEPTEAAATWRKPTGTEARFKSLTARGLGL
jgi:hypothetical protein